MPTRLDCRSKSETTCCQSASATYFRAAPSVGSFSPGFPMAITGPISLRTVVKGTSPISACLSTSKDRRYKTGGRLSLFNTSSASLALCFAPIVEHYSPVPAITNPAQKINAEARRSSELGRATLVQKAAKAIAKTPRIVIATPETRNAHPSTPLYFVLVLPSVSCFNRVLSKWSKTMYSTFSGIALPYCNFHMPQYRSSTGSGMPRRNQLN